MAEKHAAITKRDEAGLWLPGHSGNPAGRPKKKPITRALEMIYLDPAEAMKSARAIVKQVNRGNVNAFAQVTDRLEGKVVQAIEHTGTVTHELTVEQVESANRFLSEIQSLDVTCREVEE